MAPPFVYLLFILFVIVVILHPTKTNAHAREDIVERMCEHIKVSNAEPFINNFLAAHEVVRDKMASQLYGMNIAGEPPWQAFLMGQCHADLTPEDCVRCYQTSINLVRDCFPRLGGRIYLDGCFLRTANYSFFNKAIEQVDATKCGADMDDTESYPERVQSVIKKVVNKASNNGFAVERRDAPDSEQKAKPGMPVTKAIYALANCWKTLDKKSCSSCLFKSKNAILDCIPNTQGHALSAGCIIQYADYNFINNFELHIIENYTVFYFILYAVGVIGCTILAIFVGVFAGSIIYNRRSSRLLELKGLESDSSHFKKSMKFKYSTIEKASGHFSEAHKLGQGGFGEVFKGTLADGREIAIKRLFMRCTNHTQDVMNEVNVISRAEHQNLVRFLGCCLTTHDSILIYEFLPNKSLDRILFNPDRKKELDWKKRIGIIIGTAEGLLYLHDECKYKIVHRDIKASNILLDFKYRPKIADFGLAQFCAAENTLTNNAVAGTLGYMAPEYMAMGQLTDKVDVYSYGVLVLEIISGVQNHKFKPDESLETLVTSTWKHFQRNTVAEIIDESLEVDNTEEVIRAANVGLLCTQQVALLRPTMGEVVRMLRLKDEALPLPAKPPFVDESMDLSHDYSVRKDHELVACIAYPSIHGQPSSLLHMCKSQNSGESCVCYNARYTLFYEMISNGEKV